MTMREIRRAAVLDRIADHMVQNGLAPSSLRALAHAAGTSDRMLLYYFADKNEIIVAGLRTIAARLATLLSGLFSPGRKQAPNALLQEVAALMRGASFKPYMRLWLELASLAAHGEEPFRSVAGGIADGFAAMIADALDVPDEAARPAVAARLLATLDGAILLDAVGREGLATLALEQSGFGEEYR